MRRREFLGVEGGVGIVADAGRLDRVPGVGPETSFETVDAELRVDDPPAISVDGDTVVVRGTVRYGSSTCGTIDLAHAAYERSQNRLDLLVVAADDSRWGAACTDDLVSGGYRVGASAPDGLRRISATEHHVFGETFSTRVDLTEQ